MNLQETAKKARKPDVEISPLFYTRWSPRAMTGESITKEELLPLFEAARWAPSSFNNQPWRFVVAYTPKEKEKLFGLLGDFNKAWCKKAAALGVIISHDLFEHNNKPAVTHSLDTGAAWISLALEGARRGLVVHGMQGFDYEKARKVLNIPKEYTVEAMFAIGKLADASTLPKEIAEGEVPSQRKKVEEFTNFEGKFEWK